MAESSRSRVTITLGRRGPVVKRDISDDAYARFHGISGAKRSVRDRIGENYESSFWQERQITSNKRQRGDITSQNVRYSDFDDGRIRKDDLRLKLMKKDASIGAQSDERKKHIDLREKLSKPARSTVIYPGSDYRLHQPNKDVRLLQQIPLSRNDDDAINAESMKSAYSPWTLDHIRRRSTDQLVSMTRNISPHRNVDDLQRRPSHQTYDGVRSISYRSKDVLDSSRPPSTASVSFNHSSLSRLRTTAPKPVAPYVDRLPPSHSSAPPKNSYVGVEPSQTVDGLLYSLGLGKYSIAFKAEEVDMTTLKHMGENDLKEMGIPMGPRKKILLALRPATIRQP